MINGNMENPENEMNATGVNVSVKNQDAGQQPDQEGENVREKISAQASEMGNRLAEEAEKKRLKASERLRQTSRNIESWAENVSGSFDWAKEKTAVGIRQASQGVDQVASYLEENDAKAMLEDSKNLVRKYPAKSMLVGLAFGLLLGKVIR